MTKNIYEQLQSASDNAVQESIEFCKKGDVKLSLFWKNASKGYKLKAQRVTLKSLEIK